MSRKQSAVIWICLLFSLILGLLGQVRRSAEFDLEVECRGLSFMTQNEIPNFLGAANFYERVLFRGFSQVAIGEQESGSVLPSVLEPEDSGASVSFSRGVGISGLDIPAGTHVHLEILDESVVRLSVTGLSGPVRLTRGGHGLELQIRGCRDARGPLPDDTFELSAQTAASISPGPDGLVVDLELSSGMSLFEEDIITTTHVQFDTLRYEARGSSIRSGQLEVSGKIQPIRLQPKRTVEFHPSDRIEILTLSVREGGNLQIVAIGEASVLRVGDGDVRPSILEWLYARTTLVLAVNTVLALAALLMALIKFDKETEK